MTLIKIAKTDRDALARLCAEVSISCQFYTIENNDQMVQAAIGTDSPALIFGLGKQFGMKILNEMYQK